jgi:hypothetical protein
MTWRLVIWPKRAEIIHETPASVFGVKMEAARFSGYRYISTKLRGVTAQKTASVVIDTVGTQQLA